MRKLPVVCLDAGGPAVLVDASCGFKVRPGDAQQVTRDLSRALDALARNPALRRTMGRAAAIRARDKFSWSRQVSRMERLYLAVSAGRAPGEAR